MTSTVARMVSMVSTMSLRPLLFARMVTTKGTTSTPTVVNIIAGVRSSAPGKLRCSIARQIAYDRVPHQLIR